MAFLVQISGYNSEMRKYKAFLPVTIIVLALLASACGARATAEPTVDTAAIIATSIEQTMQAFEATKAAEVTPTPLIVETPTPLVLPTTASAGLPTPTMFATIPVAANCLVAGLVSETIPDGTYIARGTAFTKEWTIINGGTCPWTTGYKMVFESGELLGAASKEVALTENVNPGFLTKVSIKMTAPNTLGTFLGTWSLRTNTNTPVATFTVKIATEQASAGFYAVTSISSNLADKTFTGTCAYTVNINITSSGPGEVSGNIRHSINDTWTDTSFKETFTAAGTKTRAHTITLTNGSGVNDVALQVYVAVPNNQTFNLGDVDITCN